MRNDYVITNEYLKENYGLDLNDYALEGDLIPLIINIALDKAVDIFCEYNDNIKGARQLNDYLGLDDEYLLASDKQEAFKKLQYRIIYNLIFTAETEPVDVYVDTIISHEINLGKINNVQKGLFYRYN